MKYYFTSGSLEDICVEADSVEDVFEKAVDSAPEDTKLGVIFSVRQEGSEEDDTIYGATIPYLQALGRWEGEEYSVEELLTLFSEKDALDILNE